MLKRYSLQIILVITLVLTAGICCNALLDYGHSHSVVPNNDHIRAWAGTAREHPSMPGHNPGINPPERPAGSGGPSPGDKPAPLPPGNHETNDSSLANDGFRLLLVYTAGFLLLAGLAYYLPASGKIHVSHDDSRLVLLTLLGLGLFFRLYLATRFEGHAGDLSFFRNWSAAAARNLTHFYSNSRCDYPPLYIYILCLLGKAIRVTTLQPYTTILLKLPSILADLVTAWLIWQWGKQYLSAKINVLLAAFYIFNPAVFVNSTLWGQVDSCFTLLIALAVWTLTRNKPGLSGAFYTAAVLMKPQGIIFLPILAFELLRQRNWKTILKALVSCAAAALLIILPFAWQQGAAWIISLFTGTIGEYPFASVNAFNLFYLLGANYVQESQVPCLISYHSWGMALIILTTAYAWWIYVRKNTPRLAAAVSLLLIAGVFTLGPSMHERYLFPSVALPLLAYIALADKRFLWLAGGFSISIVMNTSLVLAASYGMAAYLVSILNILLLVYLIWVLYDNTNRDGQVGID